MKEHSYDFNRRDWVYIRGGVAYEKKQAQIIWYPLSFISNSVKLVEEDGSDRGHTSKIGAYYYLCYTYKAFLGRRDTCFCMVPITYVHENSPAFIGHKNFCHIHCNFEVQLKWLSWMFWGMLVYSMWEQGDLEVVNLGVTNVKRSIDVYTCLCNI